VTRADPPGVPLGRTTRSSRRSLSSLLAATALLLIALTGAVGHASTTGMPGPTHATVSASPADLVPGSVVLPPPSVHPLQPAIWWWIPADRLPAAALLASVLLAVAGVMAASARSFHAPPPVRGPPLVAFPR